MLANAGVKYGNLKIGLYKICVATKIFIIKNIAINLKMSHIKPRNFVVFFCKMKY